MSRRHDPDAGFTLLEVVIIVAVMAILAAAITPSLLRQIVDTKVVATRASAQAIYEGMVGKPDTKGSYGFLGDMGRLPRTPIELVRPPQGAPLLPSSDAPGGAGSGSGGLTTGWNGPYLTVAESPENVGKDSWGHDFRISQAGQVRSAGPDGTYDNEDDIVYPGEAPKITGRVIVSVKRLNTEGEPPTVDPAGYEVRLYYSNEGREAFLTASSAPFAFDNVYAGIHAVALVRTASSQVVVREVIEVTAGGTKLVDLTFRP